jgi:hypothetical protein
MRKNPFPSTPFKNVKGTGVYNIYITKNSRYTTSGVYIKEWS